jgi:sec-independent protein translocase protein TatA
MPLAFIQNIGPYQLLIILIVALLLFGRRLPEVGRSLGRGIVEFRKGLHGIEKEIEDASGPDQVRGSSAGSLPGAKQDQPFSAARPPLTDTGEDARVSRPQPGTQA